MHGIAKLIGVLFLVGLAACGAQTSQAIKDHNLADRHSAQTTKDATAKARACAGDAACVDKWLKVVDEQADAVLAVSP